MFFARKRSANEGVSTGCWSEGVITEHDGFSLRSPIRSLQGLICDAVGTKIN
ncbi:hypothetical protein [Lysinibacillus sp. CTST325]